MDVPELATRGDRAAADRWRAERRAARAGLGPGPRGPLALALATDGRVATTGRELTDAGADLVGLLAPEPLESLAWAAAAGARRAYPDLRSLLADEVEAVCLDLDLPSGGAVARAAVRAGLHLLLARPLGDDPSLFRELREGAGTHDVVVTAALDVRSWPTLPAVRELVASLGALRQVTVVGWPIGRPARLELVDLVRQVCGDVLAVCAAPSAMPAADLRPGEPVTLALLTESGATVLAAERPATSRGPGSARDTAAAAVTVVGTDGRVMFGREFLRRQDARGVVASSAADDADGPSPLALALDALEGPDDRAPSAAGLGDLLAASRVLEVAASSFESGGWLEI